MHSTTLYLRLLHHVHPYWRIFALAILAMVITALTEPLLPYLLQPLLDGGFIKQDPYIIQTTPLLILLIVVVRGVATLGSTVAMAWVASRLVKDLRSLLLAKLLTLPATDFDNTSSGVLLSKVTYDVSRVMVASTEVLITLVRDSLTVLGLLALMFYLNWQMSLILFAIVPLVILVVRMVSKRLRGMNTHIQNAMGEMTRILEEAISGHKLVKIFGGQAYEQHRFDAASEQVQRLEVRAKLTSGLSVFVVQMLTAVGLALIIYFAVWLAQQDAISVGSFVSLFTAMGMLFAPVKRLTKINEPLQQGLAAADSIFTLLDQASEPDSGGQQLTEVQGALQFRQLTFNYMGQITPAVQAIDLNIMAGETVALVGASGSGKTTLANLIPHFYSVNQGQILLDGVDIRDLTLRNLRQHIALVSQDVVLFNDSVVANIAYGTMVSASREAIQQVAQAAYAWDFIAAMPQGLDTIIGERGVKLSGGQRQRIAIARALLKNAPILIFDEATSALDTQSERQVQQALERLRQGRTTLIIAHRLSTIANANRIVVMQQGKIVEMGTHAYLLALGGHYASLYQGQMEGE